MVKFAMEIGRQEDGLPHITLNPPAGADFKPVDMVVPFLGEIGYRREDTTDPLGLHERITTQSNEVKFRVEVEDEVRQCCGNVACKGNVRFALTNQIGQQGVRIIVGSNVHCDAVGCPLDRPPEGDRTHEPVAAPPPPALQLSLELPQEESAKEALWH